MQVEGRPGGRMVRAARLVALVTLAVTSHALGACAAGAQLPAVATEAPLDVRQGVNFHALVRPDTVYVGQQASYQVGVFLNDDVRQRLRRNPEFVPPEMPGMLSYELPVAHGMLPPGRGGRYEVHVFERAVFPLTAGAHQIPAARLSYSLPLTRGFFSREESHTLRSGSSRVVALPPPAAGRPDDFDGAVATEVTLESRMDTAVARVGDPVVVTVRVNGTGNVNLFPRPRLSLPWGDAVSGDERVRLDTTARRIRGTKEFDWLVTPRSEGRVVLPAIRYPYFDPYAETYAVAFTRPDTITVAPGTLATLDSSAPEATVLPLRREFRGRRPVPPSRSPVYWLAVAALPLPVLVLGLRARPRRRERPPTAAEALASLTRVGDAPDRPRSGEAGRLRALLMRALGTRLGLPLLAHAHRGDVVRALRREGVSRESAAAVESLLEQLDRAAYSDAGDRGAGAELARRASELYEAVDVEARRRPGTSASPPRRRGPRRPGSSMTILLVAAASLPAAAGAVRAAQAPAVPPAALFAEGVAAYEDGRYADAASVFSAVARREPRAADAWANAGTASWSAADTAGAAVGWQRALRLEPTARDVRTRLALLPEGQLEGPALVPPVSPLVLEWLALALWAAAWLAAAWQLSRRARFHVSARPAVGVAAAGALAIWVSAVLLDERLAARDLAVVGETGPARSAAALTAPAARGLRAGEVVAVRERRGVWTRVRSAAGADGWVESQRLRELRLD